MAGIPINEAVLEVLRGSRLWTVRLIRVSAIQLHPGILLGLQCPKAVPDSGYLAVGVNYPPTSTIFPIVGASEKLMGLRKGIPFDIAPSWIPGSKCEAGMP